MYPIIMPGMIDPLQQNQDAGSLLQQLASMYQPFKTTRRLAPAVVGAAAGYHPAARPVQQFPAAAGAAAGARYGQNPNIVMMPPQPTPYVYAPTDQEPVIPVPGMRPRPDYRPKTPFVNRGDNSLQQMLEQLNYGIRSPSRYQGYMTP